MKKILLLSFFSLVLSLILMGIGGALILVPSLDLVSHLYLVIEKNPIELKKWGLYFVTGGLLVWTLASYATRRRYYQVEVYRGDKTEVHPKALESFFKKYCADTFKNEGMIEGILVKKNQIEVFLDLKAYPPLEQTRLLHQMEKELKFKLEAHLGLPSRLI